MADERRAGPIIERTAAQPLGGHRAVRFVEGQVDYADRANPLHVLGASGITTGAASKGQTARVQVFGPMTEPTWNWTPNLPIFVGEDGLLTQTEPTQGWKQRIAIAETSTKIFISPLPTIKLSGD